MMGTQTTPNEREDIEMLLPWYVTGRLSAAETTRVEAYLAAHPETADQLALVREELDETIAANEAIKVPAGTAGLDRLMAEIAHAEQRRPERLARGILSALSRVFASPDGGAVRWAAAAAALVILLQAAAIGVLSVGGPSQSQYQTASGQTQATPVDGTFALVKFVDGLSARELSENLAELKITVVDGPKAGGLFRIRIADTVLDDPARSERMDGLRARNDIFAFITPTE